MPNSFVLQSTFPHRDTYILLYTNIYCYMVSMYMYRGESINIIIVQNKRESLSRTQFLKL